MVAQEFKKILLSALPFKYLDHSEIERLLTYCRVVTFDNGDVLYHQGEKSNGMYIIIEGKASVMARVIGKDYINLAILDQGNFIGEVSLIEKGPCTASVMAYGSLTCLFLSNDYYDMLTLFFPETRYKIAKAITEVVCDRLQLIKNKIIDLIANHTKTRSLLSEIKDCLTKPEITTFSAMRINVEQLYATEFFNLFSKEEYDTLLQHVTPLKTPNHCTLVNEGEKQSPYFIVLCGAVQSTIIHHGHRAKLSVLGPKEIFCSPYHVNNLPALFTYTTCERAVLLKISTENLLSLNNNYPLISNKIFDLICKSFIALERAADKLLIRLNSELYNR